MKFFHAALAIACALGVYPPKISFSQSPEQTRSDAVRVTVSMHPDGSRTVQGGGDDDRPGWQTPRDDSLRIG